MSEEGHHIEECNHGQVPEQVGVHEQLPGHEQGTERFQEHDQLEEPAPETSSNSEEQEKLEEQCEELKEDDQLQEPPPQTPPNAEERGETENNEKVIDLLDTPVAAPAGPSEAADNHALSEGVLNSNDADVEMSAEAEEEPAPAEIAAPGAEPAMSVEADEEQASVEAGSPGKKELATSEADDEATRSGKRPSTELALIQVAEKVAKRPRWGDKAFADITMGDVEALVRRCNYLEKKASTDEEAMQQLKESHEETMQELKDTQVSPQLVARTKSSIAKQFLAQMSYSSEWENELKKKGRTITAYLPNVSLELLTALGGDKNVSQHKRVCYFFEKPPMKSSAGNKLVLARDFTFKYIKSSGELQAIASYKLGTGTADQEQCAKGSVKKEQVDDQEARAENQKGKGKGRGRGRGKGRVKKEQVDDQDEEADSSNGKVAEDVTDEHHGSLAVGGQ